MLSGPDFSVAEGAGGDGRGVEGTVDPMVSQHASKTSGTGYVLPSVMDSHTLRNDSHLH